MPNNKIVYLELPADNIEPLKVFYGSLFGWSFQDFGEGYTAFSDSGVEGGFNAESKTSAPLAVIETDSIGSMEEKVRQAGGTITMPTFSFPGGSRFHFLDPSGNEMAVMQPE